MLFRSRVIHPCPTLGDLSDCGVVNPEPFSQNGSLLGVGKPRLDLANGQRRQLAMMKKTSLANCVVNVLPVGARQQMIYVAARPIVAGVHDAYPLMARQQTVN